MSSQINNVCGHRCFGRVASLCLLASRDVIKKRGVLRTDHLLSVLRQACTTPRSRAPRDSSDAEEHDNTRLIARSRRARSVALSSGRRVAWSSCDTLFRLFALLARRSERPPRFVVPHCSPSCCCQVPSVFAGERCALPGKPVCNGRRLGFRIMAVQRQHFVLLFAMPVTCL